MKRLSEFLQVRMEFLSKTFSHTKVAMTGSFRKAHFLLIAFYQQKVVKTEILKLFGLRANKIYQAPFLKVAILNRSTKGD